MKRREFTTALRIEMGRRAMSADGDIICEGCGLNLRGKAIEFDHIIPEAMRLPHEMAMKLTSADGQVLGRDCCHRAPGGKTANDVANIAQAKRREAAALGIRKPSTLRSRGFDPRPPQHSATRRVNKWSPEQ
jgi:hypothetical protein